LVELLQAARKANRPALVPEVALDLAEDRGSGEGRELVAEAWVEAVDGFDETEEADLDDVLEGLATVLETPRQKVHEALVAIHQPLPQAVPLPRVAGPKVPLVELAELFSLLRSGRAQLIRYFTIRYRI
jgi:hypothetical protein